MEALAPDPVLSLSNMCAQPLPATLKGLPRRAVGQPLSALGGLGLCLLDGDCPLPVALLRERALEHNSAWMRNFVARAGASLCPHGKTTMAPQLFQRQLADGAWGITAATASHVRTYRHFGVPRILLANQLVGRENIAIIFDALEDDPEFDFYLLVDSLAALELLQRALAERPLRRPLQVLLEVGSAGGRTGVRSLEIGCQLGRALRAAGPGIVLRGVEAFEGIFGGDDHVRSETGVLSMLALLAELVHIGCEEDWFAPDEIILSAGGSAFFDIAAAVLARIAPSRAVRVVLRSGCYLSHDSFHYERMQSRLRQRAGDAWGSGPGLRNALEVWAEVQSIPEPGRAICSLGKRDISHDLCLPQPLWWFRPGVHAKPCAADPAMRVTALNDQHAFVDSSGSATTWEVGDMIGFGVGHPCTTFDKWPLLLMIDDDYRVVGGVRTYF